MAIYDQVIAAYHELGSIKKTAAEVHVSTDVVQRCLITAGIIDSPRITLARRLAAAGKSPKEIAQLMGVSYKQVFRYLPYSVGCLADRPKTRNAFLIRKSRARRRTAAGLPIRLKAEAYVEGTNLDALTGGLSPRNTSGHRGVSWDSTYKLWAACITFKGRTYHLGRYASLAEAVAAREKKEKELFEPILKAHGRL